MANQVSPEPEKDRSERWLLTYSDLITLLLVFFIVLYSISQQDAAKFQQVAESLSGALAGSKEIIGISPGTSQVQGYKGAKPQDEQGSLGKESAEQKKMQEIKKQVEELAKKQGLQASISVTLEERGIAIRIIDRVLFASGDADLSPQANTILQGIGKILRTSNGQYIRVEGHTDNVPIYSNKFASNWELSASRATNVVRLFTDYSGLSPRLFSAVACGEYRPLASNNTQQGRAKNRRVEIVILNTKFNETELQTVKKEKAIQTKNNEPEIKPAEQRP